MYVGIKKNQGQKKKRISRQLLELIRECKQNFWLCIQYMQSRISLCTNTQPRNAKENETAYNITKNILNHLGIKIIKNRQSL